MNSPFRTGSKANINKLLDLCVNEDKEWFDDNYDRIYSRSGGAAVGANPNYIIKRNVAMKHILDAGLNRTDYKMIDRKEVGREVRYIVEIPGPFNTSRRVNVKLKKEKGLWKMMELGGGKGKI